MLFRSGLQTERDYLATATDTDAADLQHLGPEKAAARTLELMRAGHGLIYQGCLQHGHWRGRPDLLVRRDEGHSAFGDFFYEAVDIKAGRGWSYRKGRKSSFKAHYAYQILFYRDLLEKIQGTAASRGRIINADGESEEFDPDDFTAKFTSALDRVERLSRNADTSEPVLAGHCSMCPWYRHCRDWVEQHDDPSGLYFVGKNKFALREQGLRTIHDLAAMDVDALLEHAGKIPGFARKSLERAKRRAGVMISGKPQIRPGYTLPRAGRHIYFDIEDDPTRNLTYLFGLVEADERGTLNFRYFLARDPADEEATVRAFWEFIAQATNAIFYVYSRKERSSLRQLMTRYDLDPNTYERFCEMEFDLYSDLVVPFSDWPTHSYGIKSIARQTGFQWRDSDPGGANSIAWYNDYLANPHREDVLQRILDYNEDDCRAMIAVRNFFQDRADASG